MTSTSKLESTDLSILNRKRSARKGVITRILNEFKIKSNPNKYEFENVMGSINRYKLEILNLDQEIMNIHEVLGDLDDDSYKKLFDSNDEYIETIEEQLSSIQSGYDELVKYKEQEFNLSFVEAIRNSSAHNLNDHEFRSNLPTLDIPVFQGDKIRFQSFIDKFDASIGNKASIENVDKFGYLLKFLKGDPFNLVESLPVTKDAYQIAMDILNKTYYDEDEIKHELALKLINLKPCKDSYHELFKFYSELESLLGQIKNSKLDIKGSSWLIEAIIFDKLPIGVKEMFQTKINKTYPNLNLIRENFPSILSLYKSTKSDNSLSKQSQVFNKGTKGKQKSEAEFVKNKGHSTLQSFSNLTESMPNFKCKFCSSTEHSTSNCCKYSSYEDRMKRCEQLKLCQRCTGAKHIISECKTKLKYKCTDCKGDHVRSMCTGNKEQKNFGGHQKGNSSNKISNGNICLNGTLKTSSMLLPTITVQLKNAKEESVDARAYIDTCSQQTFLSKSLLNKLNVPYETKIENLSLSSFARKDSDKIDLNVADISVTLGNLETSMKVVAVDNVHANTDIPGLKERVDSLQSTYKLADKFLKDNPAKVIDMLIGADYLHLVHEGIVRIGEGIALKTPVGIAPLGDISKYNLNQ